MNYARINRTAYHRLNQTALSLFAKALVNETFEETAYADVQDFVTTLKTKSESYETALELAANQGREEMHAKNVAKQELLLALKGLADAIDCYAKGDETYIVNAGFELQKKPEAFTGPLLAPTDLVVKSNGKPGQLIVSYKVSQRKHVKLAAVEWSEDKVNWHNGTYQSSTRFVLNGLPSKSDISIRLCALGSSKRKSIWTEPVTASVL